MMDPSTPDDTPTDPDPDDDEKGCSEPVEFPKWVTMLAGDLRYEHTGYWLRFESYDDQREIVTQVQGTLKSVFHCTPNVVISIGAGKGGSSEWTLDPYESIQFHNIHTDYATEKESRDAEAP